MNTAQEGRPDPQYISRGSKRVTAGIFAIAIGLTGMHKFVLGYNLQGVIILLISIVGIITTCLLVGFLILGFMGMLVVIEGIVYLSKSDEEFFQIYQVGKRPWL